MTKIYLNYRQFINRPEADRTYNGVTQHYLNKKGLTLSDINLTDCIACFNCSDCTKCTYCTDCTECIDCIDCTDCDKCSYCVFCTGCIDCNACVKCKDLYGEYND